MARDGYTVDARRPYCGRPGDMMANEDAERIERFNKEYPAGPFPSEW